jgi:hypothetical protein
MAVMAVMAVMVEEEVTVACVGQSVITLAFF